MFKWFGKFKHRLVYATTFTGEVTGLLHPFPEDVKINVFFWENGFGHRRVTASDFQSTVLKEVFIVSWLNHAAEIHPSRLPQKSL